MGGIIFIVDLFYFNMNYKGLSLLVFLVLVIVGLFYFSSWTNAMVVSEGEISPELVTLGNVSPLIAGLFMVMAVGILIVIVFD